MVLCACGEVVYDNERFCGNCGSPVVAVVASVPKNPPCYGCNASITGKYFTAFGKYYHENCFKCTSCSRLLNGSFYEGNGNAYCEADYNRIFGPKCLRCGESISGTIMKDNKGGSYHTSCFNCTQCGVPLGINFFWLRNEPACENCSTTKQMSLKVGFGVNKCSKCNGSLENSKFVTIGPTTRYHDSCFTCHTCGTQITSSYISHNEVYSCKDCVESGRAKTCNKCKLLLVGDKIVALGNHYHEDCFRCCRCSTLIPAHMDFFVSKSQDPLCALCSKLV